jgi:predicted MFS family arabinose efflux permease
MDSTHEKTHVSQPIAAHTMNAAHKDSDVATPPSSDSSVMERDDNVHGAHLANGEKHDGTNAPTDTNAPPGAPQTEQPQRSKLKIGLIMFSLMVAVLLVALDITIVTTALPTISSEFNSASGYTWVGSAYLIAQSAATPIWGKVSDIFGRKPILLVTNAIFFVGSLLAGVSVNIDMLIAARVIQGIGGGGLITLVNIAISDLFSVRDRGMYFGMIGGVWALASSLGPVVGGAFTQKVSWRYVIHYLIAITC